MKPGYTTKKRSLASKKAQNDTRLLRFDYFNPQAKSVFIAGTFNDWRPTANEMIHVGEGRWAKELTLSPGQYEYRLVIDDTWMPDPACAESAPNPYGERNSLLTVWVETQPAPSAAPLPSSKP